MTLAAISDSFGSLWAIIGFLILSAVTLLFGWWLHAFQETLLAYTTAISILAISMSQLILRAQKRGDCATHQKLDGLIAGTDADNRLIGIELDPTADMKRRM